MAEQRHTRTPILRNTSLAAAFLAISACAPGTAPGESAPDVALTTLRPGMTGPLSDTFLADLRLSNPTGKRMTVDGVTFNLSLNGTLVASGIRNYALSIAPFSDGEMTVEARAVSPLAVAHLFAIGGADGAGYTVRGEVYQHGPEDRVRPYVADGRLDLFGGGLGGGEPHYRSRGF